MLEAGQVGLLEVQADQLADAGWVRTTDLARLDEDGFLWIVGRADQTILRGGLKVQPDTVRSALERHPAVRAASVVGIDDDRLGQVPVAVVELNGSAAVDKAELLARVAVPRPLRDPRRRASSSTRCRGRSRQRSTFAQSERLVAASAAQTKG